MKWNRFKFEIAGSDPRPMVFPPPGPYWITGYAERGISVLAYIPVDEFLKDPKYWPDATFIKSELNVELEYTKALPKPDWFKDETSELPELEADEGNKFSDELLQSAKLWNTFIKNELPISFRDKQNKTLTIEKIVEMVTEKIATA